MARQVLRGMIGLVFSLAAQAVGTVTRPWRNLIWYALHLYVAAWGVLLTCSFKLIAAPFRILTAIQRQSLLEEQLLELESHVDHVVEKNRGLENLLVEVTKERQRVQEALELFVIERKKTYEKLKTRDEELAAVSFRLEETKKQLKAQALRALKDSSQVHCPSGTKGDDKCAHAQGQGTASTVSPVNKLEDTILLQGRGRAVASSLFSAALSTLVALIVWEAQDPCLPLVAALFTVVGVSLANVIQFFTKLQAKHGFDAIALMSFNWFILGTLACPAFPYIARWLPKSIGLETLLAGLFGVSMFEDVGMSEAM